MHLKRLIRERAIKMKTDSIFEYLYRGLSSLITPQLVNTFITPNHVTLFRSVVLLVGIYGFYTATYIGVLIGALSLIIWDVLDCVDGDLAVLKNKGSDFGALLEEVVDRLFGKLSGLIGFAITLGIYNQTHDWVVWMVAFILVVGDLNMNFFMNRLEQRIYGKNDTNLHNIGRKSIFYGTYNMVRNICYYELQIIMIFGFLYYPVKHFLNINSLFFCMIGFAVVYNIYWMVLASIMLWRLWKMVKNG